MLERKSSLEIAPTSLANYSTMVIVRLENFRLVVTYLQFLIQSAFQPLSAILAVAEHLFSSCYLEIWPKTLTFEVNKMI